MSGNADKLIELRRHEQELRGYATSSRWYVGLSNAISFIERAEIADDPKERFFEAWLSAYNLLMMHGSARDEEFRRFGAWVTTLINVPRIRELVHDGSVAHFREVVKKAEKTLLFDTEKKRWREGRQHLEAWSKGLSVDKTIRYFLIIIRDIRNACAHAEFNPSSAATKKALAVAADCLIPIVVAAIRATIEHPVEGTTGRITAYRSTLWPFIINSDSVFSDYYLERLFPDEELAEFPEDSAKSLLKETAKQVDSLRSGLASASAEETKLKLCEPVLFSALGIKARSGVRIVGPSGVFEPDYVIPQADVSGKPRDEYQGKDAGRELACLIWVLPWRDELDAVQTNGEGDVLPMELVQRALTASDVQWAVLTNGHKLRLLNKTTAHKARSFLELDLTAVIDRRGDADALLAFRYCLGLFSGASFTEKDDHERTRLDRAVTESERHGKEISDELKENVFHALEELGEGFLAYLRSNHDALKAWREKKQFSGSFDAFLHSDELLTDIYHESLSLMYRLLFLFYAESRNLLPMENEMYRDSYSLESIRDDIISIQDDPDPKSFFSKGDTLLWNRLKELFGFVNTGWANIIPAYNGGLFDPEQHEFLEAFKVGDHYLARAVDLLSRTRPRSGQQRGEGRKKITYRDLEIRHLGSIYEGILEYAALIADEDKVVIKRGSGGNASEEYASVSELSKEEKQQLKAWQEAVEENPDSPRLPRGCKITGLKEKGRYFLVFGGRESKRKSSGSYYTPDYIVQYIVENTLGPLVRGENREGELRNVPLTSDEILELKVLDPAMGSGHFLVAATEFLARAYTDALVAEGRDRERLITDVEFIRYKRMVAERCIYGADLNAMAVELSKVSLWLYTMDLNTPLSFLDRNLKHGNSLIGAWIEDLGEAPSITRTKKPKDSGRAFKQVDLFSRQFQNRVPLIIKDVFGIIRLETRTLRDIENKKALADDVRNLMQPFKNLADMWIAQFFEEEGKDYIYYLTEVEAARSYQSTASQRHRFFHWELEAPEVFFTEEGESLPNGGFDAVIGNPPYVRAERLDSQQLSYFRSALHAEGQTDLYLIFIHRAIRLLRSGGYFSFITPKFVYFNLDAEPTRRLMIALRLTKLADVGQPFTGVNTECVVTVLSKSFDKTNEVEIEVIDSSGDPRWRNKVSQASFWELPNVIFNIYLTPVELQVIRRILDNSTSLSALVSIKRGMEIGKEAVRLSSSGVETLLGEEVTRYTLSFGGTFVTKSHAEIKRLRSQSEVSEKILIRRVCADLTATIDEDGYFFTKNLYGCLNASAVSLKYVLGILNSKLMNFFFRKYFTTKKQDIFPEFQKYQLDSLPIRVADRSNPAEDPRHSRMVGLVEKMLELKKRAKGNTPARREASQSEIEATDRQIDSLVYELYELNDEAIAVIEQERYHPAHVTQG